MYVYYRKQPDALQFCRWSCINSIGDIVHIQQIDLLKNVISIIQWSSRGCQTCELLY